MTTENVPTPVLLVRKTHFHSSVRAVPTFAAASAVSDERSVTVTVLALEGLPAIDLMMRQAVEIVHYRLMWEKRNWTGPAAADLSEDSWLGPNY